jgi:hypothetical protein
MDEQSEHRKLKQATDAAAKIQRESGTPKDPTRLETTPEPLQKPPPVQIGGDAWALSSSQVSVAARHLMDELERLRDENLGLQSRIHDLRAQVRRLEDWHDYGRCNKGWSAVEDNGDGRRITIFGPSETTQCWVSSDRELWEVIEALNGAKEMDDESLSETAQRVCNPEVHATIQDGVRDLMLKDLLGGLKQRGFPDLSFPDGGSAAAAILRSIDERIDAIIKANQEVADDEHRAAKVERDGLIAQVAELRRSGVSEAESESVLRANELEAECDRLRDEVREANQRATRARNHMGWIRNQVIKAVLAMDSGANPLEACQRSRPILDVAIAETPAVPDGQHDPHEVERLRRLVAELGDELKVRDRTLGQLADVAEERDALLVRVETLEQQAGRRPPNPMESTAPPDTWQRDVDAWSKLINHVANLQMEVDAFKRFEEQSDVPVEIRMLKEQVRGLEAKVQVSPAGIGEWTRLVNCVANLQSEFSAFKRDDQSKVEAVLQMFGGRIASLEAKLASIPVDDPLGRSRTLDDALRRIARLECLLCGEEGSGAEMIEEMVRSEADRPSYRQVIAEAAEAKDQFGTLLGIVELDGRTIREHAERLGKIEEGFGGHAERIKTLLEQSTSKSWWRR